MLIDYLSSRHGRANTKHQYVLDQNFYVFLPVEAFAAFAMIGPPRPPVRTLRELRTERPQACQRAALRI